MKTEHYFVFDTNVLLSAFLFRAGVPRQALDRALHLGKMVTSDQTLAELQEVLMRPKFDRYLPLETRLALLQGWESMAERQVVTHTLARCRDPKDGKFLNLALSAQATYLVTGDLDLLALSGEFPIIITPAAFLLAAVGLE